MSTINGWNNQIAAANSAITLNSGTNTVSISTDATATTVNIGTGGGVKSLTVGSTNGASASTLQCGSGALNVTSTNGAMTINSGTGTLAISNDASATTVNIATGGAAKVVTLGSTNGASSLALKCGTADFTIASATGTLMSILDTGPVTKPLQPSFAALKSATTANVTGDGTDYTVIFDQESFDVGGNYNNGTGIFTAPVTGKYFLSSTIVCTNIGAAHTNGNMFIKTTAINYLPVLCNAYAISTSGYYGMQASVVLTMTAGDTAYATTVVANGGKTVGVYGNAGTAYTFFGGYLAN